ncbi:MAG: DNA mismatch repair protein MutS [Devosiaceae bacterium]|nr:DNA mismatch repair protein MutS [Devosiaceae bacterium MH13]
MAQYLEIKAANADSLLFFRMGDFYELFFDDAVVAAQTLGIALTKRGKHGGDDIPMAGVPVHAAQDYLHKLIAAGHRVAVCEQTEDPAEAKKRGSKAIVRRDVTRLVTAGTLTEDALLPSRGANWLVALAPDPAGTRAGLAWLDLSTGAFHLAEIDAAQIDAELARLAPAETIYPDALDGEHALYGGLQRLGGTLSPLPASMFHGGQAPARMAAAFGVASTDSFGSFSRAELRAGAALVGYVERTQKSRFQAVQPPKRERSGSTMSIDAATRASLDLVRADTSGAPTLLSAIDRSVTSAGTRLLAQHLGAPLTDRAAIEARLDAVEHFVDAPMVRQKVRDALAGAPDLARALSRVVLGRGGPRDLAAIGSALHQAGDLLTLLSDAEPALIREACATLESRPHKLAARLHTELADELPLLARDGGFVAKGVDADLDAARVLRDDTRKVIAGLQATYGAATGARSLKVKHNGVLGYFIEVPTAQAGPLQDAPDTYFHRQTMANAMRFSTKELAELEAEIASAGARAIALEVQRFEDLCALVVGARQALQAVADALAALDVAQGLAETAALDRHVRPVIRDDTSFAITAGRHPVVEKAMRKSGGERFIANDCALGADGGEDGRVALVTGPNMGGKSTYLRQNALIAILAQAGAFVPAQAATIGIVDALFSRVGASDDLAQGRSTFMVEMVETAAILHQASPRSLVILDEIGRGTATYDGLSIAWAALEHLHTQSRSRALFATHYHELTVLSERLDRLENRTLAVREWDGEVIFLHEVLPGAADRSYGIQVAKLAGLPEPVVARARQVLDHLERRGDSTTAEQTDGLFEGLPLFAAAKSPAPMAEPSADAVEAAARTLVAGWFDGHDPDQMTPRQALDFLYDLSAKLKTP